jgi:hypothetical protein
VTKVIKSIKYFYNEKLNDNEKYYVDLFIYKLIHFLLFVWDHKYLRYTMAVMLFLIIFNIVTSIIYNFALGIDLFLQTTGLKKIILEHIQILNYKLEYYLNLLLAYIDQNLLKYGVYEKLNQLNN